IGLGRIKRSDGHERGQHVPDGFGVDPGRIPGHDAARLQPADPGLDGRHRQPRLRRQMRQRGPYGRDQFTRQGAIERVERFAHGGTVSKVAVEVTRRSDFWEPWRLRAEFAAALSRLYGAEVPAYNTLVAVSAAVNRELGTDDRLGSLDRVTAERHGAIRV